MNGIQKKIKQGIVFGKMNSFVDILVKEKETLNKQYEELFNFYKTEFNNKGFLLNYRYYTPESSHHYAYYSDMSVYELCFRILEDFREDFDADFISIYDLSNNLFIEANLIQLVDHLNLIRDDCFAYVYQKA
jgi:hypothetical protein